MSDLRPEIAASWRRLQHLGLDRDGPAVLRHLSQEEVAERRSRHPFASCLEQFAELFRPVVDCGHLVVLSDAEGRVLWQYGHSGVRSRADRLGFVGGADWTETSVGTNAIGTALQLGRPVTIRGGEHFVAAHAAWDCTAAPVCDPDTGQTLGVLDVSAHSPGRHAVHPAEASLVQAAARMVTMELAQARSHRLERLRAQASPLLARVGGRALVTDPDGRVAAVVGMPAPAAVSLPSVPAHGVAQLPGHGLAALEPVPGGWLIRLDADGSAPAAPSAVVLDLRGAPRLCVRDGEAPWEHDLTPRHAELLLALAQSGPEGCTAEELSCAVFDEPSSRVTVRAEMSRLRRVLGPLVLSRPYRLAVPCEITWPADRALLLPRSVAPVVRELRGRT
ncbi:transcriptional regulator [Nesterenkonia sp. K-15-9-6]|uniref:transcriptional regulator n=1 Tax=Nesterenkonia sp. K-15-9-6 TaxID=3093918 RepID=UPI004043CDE9